MKSIQYKTQGTCSQYIYIEADENRIIQDIQVIGGCDGNLKGLCSLIKGRRLDEIKENLSGILCRNKLTSCPDQISKAIAELEKQY